MRTVVRVALAALVGVALLVAPAPSAMAAPANDDYADGKVLSGTKGVVVGSSTGATLESRDVDHCVEPSKANPGGYHTVWYRWTAPTNGWLRVGITTYGKWTGYADGFDRDYYPFTCWPTGSSAIVDVTSEPGYYREIKVKRGQRLAFVVYGETPDDAGTFAFAWRLIPYPSPLNNRFAAADAVSGQYGTAYGRTVNASRESGEPLHAGRSGGRSVWFRWTAPASGPAMFQASAGSASYFDCLIGVYTGSTVGGLTRVSSDSGTWAGKSCHTRLTATAGRTYRIAVDGENGIERHFQLHWNSGTPPSNDKISAAKLLTGDHGVVDGSTRGATDSPGESADALIHSGSTTWYRWTAPRTGEANFRVDEPPFAGEDEYDSSKRRRIAVFRGPPDDLELIGASFDNAYSYGVDFGVTKGSTFYVQISAAESNARHYVLAWEMSPPSNDDFAHSMVLPPTGTVSAGNGLSTGEPGEPQHGRYPAKVSVWFSWTAPRSGQVTFDNYTGAPSWGCNCALAVYTGDRMDALTHVPVPYERTAHAVSWTFSATGTTYRIALDDDHENALGRWAVLNWFYGSREVTDPTVTLTAPGDGARVSGKVTVDAAASDGSGITFVGFNLVRESYGDTWGPEPQAKPYTRTLDTHAYADGPIELYAFTRDQQSNQAESAHRTVVIQNRRPTAAVRGFSSEPRYDNSGERSWNADEPLSSAQCRLDDAAYADCFAAGSHDQNGGIFRYANLADGVHVFRVLTTDKAGNRSVDSDAEQWVIDTQGLGVLYPGDSVAPTATGPIEEIRDYGAIGMNTVPVWLNWTSRDVGVGVQKHDIQVSVDGGTWTARPGTRSDTETQYQLEAGHRYRFRVRAWDMSGNVSAWAYGNTFELTLAQENSTAWTWSSGWHREPEDDASGGFVQATDTAGESGVLTFSGRAVAIYGPRTSYGGVSRVYLDGEQVGTIDQYHPGGEAREQLFVRTGLDGTTTHTLEVRSLGTGYGDNTEVEIDAVAIVR